MKIEQKQEFQPITITLETVTEANALWDVINSPNQPRTENDLQILNSISDWFCNKAQFSQG